MTDLNALVQAIGDAAPDAPVRYRMGQIISVQSNGTVTITVGGGTTEISGVKVASSCCPLPGATCWIATDGRDMFVTSTLAPSGPAFGQVRQNANQTIATATWTTLSFATRTDVVESGITVTNTGFTIVVPGLYTISAHHAIAYAANGSRFLSIGRNGTPLGYVATGAMATNDTTRITSTVNVTCQVGDTITADVNQGSGGNLQTINSPGYNVLRAVWIGPIPG